MKYLGIDIGGTSVKLGLVTDKGKILASDNYEVAFDNYKTPIFETVKKSIERFLKDNSIASINNKTDYVETTSTEYSSGKISLDHSGAYVARFYVTWDEVSYDKDGNEVLKHKAWDGNGYDRTAHFYTEIPLDGNARNIRVKAEECTGLAWEWWRDVISEYDVPLTNNINVSIWGTTLYPGSSITYN